jgi:sugar lactone lactonase YvrE
VIRRSLLAAAATLALAVPPAELVAAEPSRAEPASPGTAGERADVVDAYLAAWNAGPPAFERLLTEDFVDRSMLLPLDRGPFMAQVAAWRAAVPDLEVTLLERASSPGREVLRLRYAGKVANAPGLLTYSGSELSIEQTEWLSVTDGRIGTRRALLDEWTLPAEWMFAAPPAAPYEPYAAKAVAELEPGRFLESIAIAPDGRLFVSTGLDGGISVVTPGGEVTPFARVDVGPGGFMMCLAFDRAGTLHATVNSRNDDVRGVWRFTADGRGSRIAALPPGAVPNGIAIDARGDVLVADSFGGLIWQVPARGGEAKPWLRHDWLRPRPLVGRYPGANGLQIAGDFAYVASSDRGLLLRIPIGADGGAGAPEVYVNGMPADDFTVASDGTLYLTTHPFDTVVKLTRDGRRSVVAGPAQGVIGPTAAAITREGALYVVTDGGLYRPSPGQPVVPRVVRLEPPSND